MYQDAMEIRKIDRPTKRLYLKYFNTERKRGNCLYCNCNNNAINSDIIQKQILINISRGNKIMAYKVKQWCENERVSNYSSVGVSEHSEKVFCSKHDNDIFAPIETNCVDWTNPKSQYLLSYRALCNELRSKQVVRNATIKYLDDNKRNFSFDYSFRERLINAEISISKIQEIKSCIELALQNGISTNISFTTVILPFYIELCVMSLMTVGNMCFIVNIFPYNGKTYFVINNIDSIDNDWGEKMIKVMQSNDYDKISSAICEILQRAEYHCMSYDLYDTIPPETISSFLAEFDSNIYNFAYNINTKVNLFSEFIHDKIE